MAFGVRDKAFCFALPGNPVSSFVMFELLVKPFLYKMMGHDFTPPVTRRKLGKTISRKIAQRDSWLPVVFTQDGRAELLEYHGSAHINALCEADALLCVPAGTHEIKQDSIVAVRHI
jgi:molybdopterin molybdotransferase